MALTWDVREVANYQYVTTSPATRNKTDKEWHPVAHAIIMASMVCGYGHITEKNYKKIARRLAQYQMLGALLGSQVMPKIYITEEDVRQLIGLRLNVADMSEAKWRAHVFDMIDRDCASIQSGLYNHYNLPEDFVKEESSCSAFEVFERLWACKQKEAANG